MQTLLKKLIRASASWKGMAVAAVVLGGAVQTSQARPGSADPSSNGTFTWDLTSSGSGQRGIALITFSNDFSGNGGSFRGYQMFAALPPVTNSATGGRGGSSGRGGSGGSANGRTNHFFFGFTPITGTWTLSSKGEIFGFFSEALNVTSTVTNFHPAVVQENIVNSQTLDTTNIFIVFTSGQSSVSTNFAWANPPGYTQIYTFQNQDVTIDVGSAQETNTVSFTGKAVTGKRLTLLCNTTFGKVTYRGKPAQLGIDISGNWIGDKRSNGQQFNELFSLNSFSQSNPFPEQFPDIANFPNLFFTTNGMGAGYGFKGVAIFSQNKTVGFTFWKDDGTMSSTIGNLKAKRFGATAKTEGIEEPLNRVNFTATLQ